VRHLLHGDTANIIKSFGISDAAIHAARKCIKTLDMGGGARELYKIGVSYTEAMRLIKFMESKKHGEKYEKEIAC
jgi:hypothetical protein